MSLTFSCPTCRRAYTVDEALAGKRARCKQCGTTMPIPTPDEPEGSPPGTLYGLDEVDASPAEALPPRAGSGTRTAVGSRRAVRARHTRTDEGP